MENETKNNSKGEGGVGGWDSNLTQGETSIEICYFRTFGVVLMMKVYGPSVYLVACKVRASIYDKFT